jgi:hypothetical protein
MMETQDGQRRRKPPNFDGPPQITRIPPWRPGMWVKLKDFDARSQDGGLSGKVRRVKSLTCSLSSPEQRYPVWRVHFEDGRCLEWHLVAREATEGEVRRAEANGGGR